MSAPKAYMSMFPDYNIHLYNQCLLYSNDLLERTNTLDILLELMGSGILNQFDLVELLY